jgi:hypothetical protein
MTLFYILLFVSFMLSFAVGCDGFFAEGVVSLITLSLISFLIVFLFTAVLAIITDSKLESEIPLKFVDNSHVVILNPNEFILETEDGKLENFTNYEFDLSIDVPIKRKYTTTYKNSWYTFKIDPYSYFKIYLPENTTFKTGTLSVE